MTVLLKLMPGSDSRYGEFVMGATGTYDMIYGDYRITNGVIRLDDHSGIISTIDVVGRSLKDDHGYWTRKR